MSCHNELFRVSSLWKEVCDTCQGRQESVKKAVMDLLNGQKEQVLGQRPDLGDIVRHVLPHIQVRHWKKVGLAIYVEPSTLNELGQEFTSDKDCYVNTLNYWLKHNSSVTWKTLVDIFGLFETKNTVDRLTNKILSVLGRSYQVSVQALCVE